MELVVTILILNFVIWYLADRFKGAWENLTYGKYITIGVVLILSAIFVFPMGLDILFALGVFGSVTIQGQIVTVLTMMSGSSAVSEIVNRIKNGIDKKEDAA